MAADAGDVTVVALLDLRAAFDMVDQVILLQRLQTNYHVIEIALQWFRSFFHGRYQSVCITCRWNINFCIGSSWCSSEFETWTVIVHSLHVCHFSYYSNGWITMHVLCWWYPTLLSFEDTQYAGGKVSDRRLHQPCPPMANKQQTVWIQTKLRECGVRLHSKPPCLNAHRLDWTVRDAGDEQRMQSWRSTMVRFKNRWWSH